MPFFIQPIDTLSPVEAPQDDAELEDRVGATYRSPGKGAYVTRAISSRRMRLALMIVIVVLVILVGRSAWMQIHQGSLLLSLAEGNRIQSETLPSLRGKIFDRSGKLLAYNEPSFTLWVQDETWSDPQKYVEMIRQGASLLGVDESTLHDSLLDAARSGGARLVAHDVSHERAMRVLAAPEIYPAFEIQSSTERVTAFPNAVTLSSILGYVGLVTEEEYAARKGEGYAYQDVIGKTGVEQAYEMLLRGRPGERKVETDAFGQVIAVLSERQPIDGVELTLHLDVELQEKIEALLEARERKGSPLRAAVVVMDPRDGAIRALVSYPGYAYDTFGLRVDTQAYRALVEDERRPLFARAIAGQYPSGSTIKPVGAAAALEEGLIDERTSFLSTGGLRIGQFFFPDWRAGGHGVTDVRRAIADSVNTFFYIIGGGYDEFQGLGLARLMSYADRFGFGSPLGIDMSGEASGFLPSDQWKRETKGEPWYIGDTYHVSIGQGDILVTPLQITAMMAVFANGGTLFAPQLVDRYVEQGRAHEVDPRVLESQVVGADTVRVVREGLRQGVTQGSSIRLNALPVEVAGKTGTAQWHSEKESHAWFTGFAPYQDPQIVVTILIEEGGEGSAVAVPLAHDILSWWFSR